MPLVGSVDIAPQLGIKAADILQYFNLFTGVLQDQPVNFKHQLLVGGGNTISAATPVLTIKGIAGQSGSLIVAQDSTGNPLFEVGPTGSIIQHGAAGITTGAGGLTVGGGNVDLTGAAGMLKTLDPFITGQIVVQTGVYNLPTVAGNTGKWRFTKAVGGTITVTPATGEAVFAPGATAASAANATYVSPNGESVGWYCNGVNWYGI